jgi:hypothetical protein
VVHMAIDDSFARAASSARAGRVRELSRGEGSAPARAAASGANIHGLQGLGGGGDRRSSNSVGGTPACKNSAQRVETGSGLYFALNLGTLLWISFRANLLSTCPIGSP